MLEQRVEGLLGLLASSLSVVEVADVACELTLELVRVSGAVGEGCVDLVDLVDRERGAQAEVARDELVGDRHELAVHVRRLVGEADVVLVALGHLLVAVESLEKRHRERDLRLHAHVTHEVTSGEKVEDLVVAAHLEVGLDDDGIVRLEHGVDELVQRDGLAVDVAVVEVLALEDARHVELAHELEHVSQGERLDPVAVVDDARALGVEDLHGLRDVGLRVLLDLLLGEGRTGAVASGRVADEGGAVADDERDVVAELLELTHLAQGHGMAEVQVGARGIDAQLDVEGRALLELLPELVHGHDLHRPRSDDLELLVDWQHCSVLHE